MAQLMYQSLFFFLSLPASHRLITERKHAHLEVSAPSFYLGTVLLGEEPNKELTAEL